MESGGGYVNVPAQFKLQSRFTEPTTRPLVHIVGDVSIEREMQQQLFQSEDAKEGLGAYVGKRKAEFQGR